jgi:UDP-N-acetylmuramate dehydrogenase
MKSYRQKLQGLAAAVRGECLFDEPMSRHTSFRLGGPADLFISPADPADLAGILRSLGLELNYIIIGNGSNLLVSDRGIRGAVILIGRGFRRLERRGAAISAGAGLSLPGLVDQCRAMGLSGLEWAAGIPGSLGGALVMNAGAYGGQMADVVERVYGLLPSGRPVELKPAEINFSYRRANYPSGFVITGCRLRLATGRPASIKRLMDKWLGLRRRNQPLSLPSAGCIFKNPEGDSARRLIGVAGMRGRRVGGAQVSRKHANFIVNYGGAKASHVKKLMDQVAKAVRRQCGVTLEPEVKIIGEW